MTEIANRIFQVGIEAGGAPGTPVAATREWYGMGRVNDRSPEPSMRTTERASYDAHHGAEKPIEDFEWSYEGGLDLDDIVEQLLVSVKRGVTPTTPVGTVRLWTFKPDNTAPATATLRYDAAGDVYVCPYAMADTIEISGGVSGGDVTVSLSGMVKDMPPGGALTVIADTVQRVIQGWETQFYIDAFGATPLTTEKDAELLSWRVRLTNELARFRGSSNLRGITRLSRQRRKVESEFVVDMAATALAEIVKKRAVTKMIAGLRIGENDLIEGAHFRNLEIAVPGAYTSSEIAEDGGVSTVRFSHRGVYDPTLAAQASFAVKNTRST